MAGTGAESTTGTACPPQTLVEICLQAAAAGSAWEKQRRSVESLPPDLANELLRRLLRAGAFAAAPQLLQRFSSCVTSVALEEDVELGPAPAQTVAYLALYRCLESLTITRACARRLRDPHLAELPRRAATLRALSLRGCTAVGATKPWVVMEALQALTALRSLDVSYTGLGGPKGLRLSELLPALPGLTSLQLAGLQLDEPACAGLTAAPGLRDLDLSDSRVSQTFVQRALGGLTALTALRLAWCTAGALPVFGCVKRLDVSGSSLKEVVLADSGGEVRLSELRAAGTAFEGMAALALTEILSASAPTLEELDAPLCSLEDPFTGVTSGPLRLIPALQGATRLRRLALSSGPNAAAGGGSSGGAHQWQAAPPPPLADLGLTRLSELQLGGWPFGGPMIGDTVRGLASLRRLDLSGAAPGVLHAGSGPWQSAFDDAALAALAAAAPLCLQELDVSYSRVEGRFEGLQGPGNGEGEAAAAAAGDDASWPWGRLRALRVLRLHGSGLVGQQEVARLAGALGLALRELSIGRAAGGGSLEPAALAKLCARMPALRRLRVDGGLLAPPSLEAHVPKLSSLSRLELFGLSPIVCDAPRLARLARRLRAAGAAVVLDGKEVAAGPCEAAAAAPRRPGRPGGSEDGGGGGSHAAVPSQAALLRLDQRLRYGRERLLALRGGAAVATAALKVRAALGVPASTDVWSLNGGDSGPLAGCREILRSDW